MNKPLALKLTPNTIDDVIGQKHLLGEGKIIRNLVKNKKLFSMILYGKPGIGKTTIATAIVKDLDVRYRFLNATINNKKDFDTVVEEAKLYGGIVLIMDEIHRLNKDKQDLLLPQLESGLITLIGMTTSNPYHKINPAIRSRCQIFELKDLTETDIIEGLNRAIKHEDLKGIKIDKDSIKHIAGLAGNDLRYAYNLLEMAFYSSSDKKVTLELLKSINNKPVIIADNNESGHYDLLSAFQKSIRGSDVDAALHYLARLIEIGDLDSIYRRMSVICYEDIGLANPDMGPRVMAAISASELVGLPEARIPLGEIVIELALSPKSNTAHIALDKALEDVETGRCGDIPETIKIHSTIYKYPHDYPNNYVVQQYLPDNLIGKKYYIPKDSSPYERMLKQIKEKLDKIKENN
ncbi:MAG: replication-associated recombination protein A [Firmicutes bacterium]|nr:replication-associated recombination protein A [Bacillota bacterium]